MRSVFSLADRIHAQAVEAATLYKRAEAALIEVLQQVDEHRVFLKRGHASLFAYVIAELGLAESAAYSLITVARKAREVPELKAQIQAGNLTLSNARRIVPVLHSTKAETAGISESNAKWIKMACELSNRALEKEIIKVRPGEATRERASYVTPDRVKLELGLAEYQMLRLRRVQDVLSQSKMRPVSLEETIQVLTSEFLSRHDPVEKAKRHQVKKGPHAAPSKPTTQSPPVVSPPAGELVTLRVQTKRMPIPASVLHQVNLRDQRRCTYSADNEKRCDQSRWVEIHHRIPVNKGGENSSENLTTLCSAHHKLWHLQNRHHPG